MYYKAPIELISDYQRISTLLHRSSEDYKPEGEKLDPSPMKYVEEYIAQCEQDKDSLANLVGPIRNALKHTQNSSHWIKALNEVPFFIV